MAVDELGKEIHQRTTVRNIRVLVCAAVGWVVCEVKAVPRLEVGCGDIWMFVLCGVLRGILEQVQVRI